MQPNSDRKIGVRDGLCHDLLQHRPQHRWNEQPGISHGFRRNEDHVAGCLLLAADVLWTADPFYLRENVSGEIRSISVPVSSFHINI